MVNFTRTKPWTIYPKPGVFYLVCASSWGEMSVGDPVSLPLLHLRHIILSVIRLPCPLSTWSDASLSLFVS